MKIVNCLLQGDELYNIALIIKRRGRSETGREIRPRKSYIRQIMSDVKTYTFRLFVRML